MLPSFTKLRRFCPSFNTLEKQPIFLLGSGRSGTTWLAEQIVFNSRAKLVFEPLHQKVIKTSVNSNRLYLRAGEKCDSLENHFDRITRGKVVNYWSNQQNNHLYYNGIIIKLIRANLMADWLMERYQFASFSLVLRNPMHVAISQMRSEWALDIERFKKQKNLIVDYREIESLFDIEVKNQFQLNILHWFIENYVCIHAFTKNEYKIKCQIFYYEELKYCSESFREFMNFNGVQEYKLHKVSIPSQVKGKEKNDDYIVTQGDYDFYSGLIKKIKISESIKRFYLKYNTI